MSDEEKKEYRFDSNKESSSEAEESQAEEEGNGEVEESPSDIELDESPDTESTDREEKGEKDTWEPILLEGEGVTECPNCGASMPEEEEVLCLRCGFDLSSMQKVTTETGDVEVEPTAEEEAAQKPELSPAGPGGIYLPAVIAGLCVIIMAVGFLAAASGLYPSNNGLFLSETHSTPIDVEKDFTLEHPGFFTTVVALAKYCVFTVIMTACTLTALFVVSRLDRQRLGEFSLLSVRCLAIITACQVVRLIGFDQGWSLVEQILQLLLVCGVFFGLSKAFFRTDTRQTVMFGGVTVVTLVLLFVVSGVLVWSRP